MPHKSLSTILLLLSVFAFSACQFNSVYNNVVSIEEDGWDKEKALHFEVNISDTISLYDFSIIVHNTTDYRYSNLFVFLTTQFPNGNLSRDTIECVLADASGKWYGKGWGNIKETDILLKPNLKFPLSGQYNFYVQQAMRKDTLQGIQRIGIRLDKSEKN